MHTRYYSKSTSNGTLTSKKIFPVLSCQKHSIKSLSTNLNSSLWKKLKILNMSTTGIFTLGDLLVTGVVVISDTGDIMSKFLPGPYNQDKRFKTNSYISLQIKHLLPKLFCLKIHTLFCTSGHTKKPAFFFSKFYSRKINHALYFNICFCH
jgi:hypothetical protein